MQEEINEEAEKRLRSFLRSQSQSESTSGSSYQSFPKPSAPPIESERSTSNFGDNQLQACDVGAVKEVFIRKIEVLLNGTPIDQVEDKQNVDECIQAYWRMFTFNGQMNSLFTNGIRQNKLYILKYLILLYKLVILA